MSALDFVFLLNFSLYSYVDKLVESKSDIERQLLQNDQKCKQLYESGIDLLTNAIVANEERERNRRKTNIERFQRMNEIKFVWPFQDNTKIIETIIFNLQNYRKRFVKSKALAKKKLKRLQRIGMHCGTSRIHST